MNVSIPVPASCDEAQRRVEFFLQSKLPALTKDEFLSGWCSLFFLYPGLHPDGFASRDSGWPRRFKPFAKEAWRRFADGELNDGEIYCYQAVMARIRVTRGESVDRR